MSDMTVGPIQTYLGNSTLSAPSINQNPVQGNVAITLTDSNLWLVDTTKLGGQTSNPAAQFSLVDLQTKYQTVVPFDNVNFNASTIASAALTTSEGSYLQSSLPKGDLFMLTSVTGGTQLSSDGISLTSSGSNGGSTGGIASSGASGGLSKSSGGSASSGGGASGGGGGSAGASGGSATPGSSSNSTSAGQATPTAQTTTSANSQGTASPQATVSPQAPTPVPLEVSPTIGLLLVVLLFSHKFVLRKMAFKPMSVKVTS